MSPGGRAGRAGCASWVGEKMPRISWVLLLAAILAATVTVVVMASAGPAWPQSFATCGGDGILAAGSAARDRAIADWHDWWLGVYFTGLASSVPLAAAWARAAGWRPSRR